MKKLMLLASSCVFALTLTAQALAAPSCPSANQIKSVVIDSSSPAEKKGWYLASGSNATLSIFAFVQAKNTKDANKLAHNMLQQVTTSWAPPKDIGISDPDTGKEYYVCVYKPYANVDVMSVVGGGEPSQPAVAALIEGDNSALVTKRKLF